MPFCSTCSTWKKTQQLGRIDVPRAIALEAITSGEIIRLAGQGLSPVPGRLSLAAAVCPNCGPLTPVDVSFKEVTIDKKGVEHQSEIAHVTYPGHALKVLEALFERDTRNASSMPESLPTADRAAKRKTGQRNAVVLRPIKPQQQNETWRLEIDEETATLLDSADEVMAVIRRDEAQSRLVWPSFWESVRNLGILADHGKVIWFKPDKTAIKEIKKALEL